MTMTTTAQELLMTNGHLRTAADIIALARKQSALMVLRVNEGHTFSTPEFNEKVYQVFRAMLAELTANLTALGRADLVVKIRTAERDELQARVTAELRERAYNEAHSLIGSAYFPNDHP
jgi:hypothetical protein